MDNQKEEKIIITMVIIVLVIMMILLVACHATRKKEGWMIKRKRSHRSESRTAKHCITPPLIIWIIMRMTMMIMTKISLMVDDDDIHQAESIQVYKKSFIFLVCDLISCAVHQMNYL